MQISNNTTASSMASRPTTFPNFMALPTEIRLKIWENAISQPTVNYLTVSHRPLFKREQATAFMFGDNIKFPLREHRQKSAYLARAMIGAVCRETRSEILNQERLKKLIKVVVSPRRRFVHHYGIIRMDPKKEILMLSGIQTCAIVKSLLHDGYNRAPHYLGMNIGPTLNQLFSDMPMIGFQLNHTADALDTLDEYIGMSLKTELDSLWTLEFVKDWFLPALPPLSEMGLEAAANWQHSEPRRQMFLEFGFESHREMEEVEWFRDGDGHRTFHEILSDPNFSVNEADTETLVSHIHRLSRVLPHRDLENISKRDDDERLKWGYEEPVQDRVYQADGNSYIVHCRFEGEASSRATFRGLSTSTKHGEEMLESESEIPVTIHILAQEDPEEDEQNEGHVEETQTEPTKKPIGQAHQELPEPKSIWDILPPKVVLPPYKRERDEDGDNEGNNAKRIKVTITE